MPRQHRAAGEELRASAYRSYLELAREGAIVSISFPPISTGVYGYPLKAAAPAAVGAAAGVLREGPTSVEEVTFVLFDRRTFDAYAEALRAV